MPDARYRNQKKRRDKRENLVVPARHTQYVIFLLLKDETQVFAREKGTRERKRGWEGNVMKLGFNYAGGGS